MTGIVCRDCGRGCGALRTSDGGEGFCGCGLTPRVALAKPHFGEEPCISGTKGSGAVFFSGCSLKCVFCQNYGISHNGTGYDVSIERLAEIFRELETAGVHNINLVNPTHYTAAIDAAMRIRRPDIPVVYNTGAYDSPETVLRASEWADVFLPDLKLYSPSRCKRYLGAGNYFQTAVNAIDTMLKLRPENVYRDGLLISGVIIRILVLPCNADQACAVADYIADTWGTGVTVSVMSQYYPAGRVKTDAPELDRNITKREYERVCRHFIERGFENGYFQDMSSGDGAMTPDFNGEGVVR